jgi:hypothetical protein
MNTQLIIRVSNIRKVYLLRQVVALAVALAGMLDCFVLPVTVIDVINSVSHHCEGFHKLACEVATDIVLLQYARQSSERPMIGVGKSNTRLTLNFLSLIVKRSKPSKLAPRSQALLTPVGAASCSESSGSRKSHR